MEFDILGPIQVSIDGLTIDLGPPSSRALLADLLLHDGESLTIARLAEDVTAPAPAEAEVTTESLMTQLRSQLGADRLVPGASGWRLEVSDHEVDARLFQADVEAAREQLTEGDPAAATERLDRAMARWRGAALADVRSYPWVEAEAELLDEQRLVAQDLLLDAWLLRTDLDRGLEIFESAVHDAPEREGVWARYMVALYRVGRATEALAAYQRLRAALGGDPSDWVVRIERDIAFRDPALLQPTAPNFLPWSRVALASSHRADVDLPDGIVVTFLMTDVVGSTRLWEQAPRPMRSAMARHDQLMIEAVESHSGVVIRERGEGDSTFSVFRRATDAVAAAVAAQMLLADEPWHPDAVLSLRMALHTAQAELRDGDYYGRPVNRVARLRAIAEGGQILASQSTAQIVMDHLPEGSLLRSLGPKVLKDMDRPEIVYEVGGDADRPPDSVRSEGSTDAVPIEPAGDGGIDRHEVDSRSTRVVWELVVGADRHYYDSNGEGLGPLPAAVPSRSFPLSLPVVVIGRGAPGSDVTPDLDLGRPPEDVGVSRGHHAVLERQPDGRYAIADAASTNGTFVNDLASPIPSGIRTMLEEGDRIYLGNFTCLLLRRVATQEP